jgi:hypothetical protein
MFREQVIELFGNVNLVFQCVTKHEIVFLGYTANNTVIQVRVELGSALYAPLIVAEVPFHRVVEWDKEGNILRDWSPTIKDLLEDRNG